MKAKRLATNAWIEEDEPKVEVESTSKDSFLERSSRYEISGWVAETTRRTEDKTPREVPDVVWKKLNPLAPEFHQLENPTSGGALGGLEDMVHALTIPKVDMMTCEGDPVKYWTFIKAFDNSIGRYKIDEHAKLARLLHCCRGRAYGVIESCAAMETGGYGRARDLLHERFGDG